MNGSSFMVLMVERFHWRCPDNNCYCTFSSVSSERYCIICAFSILGVTDKFCEICVYKITWTCQLYIRRHLAGRVALEGVWRGLHTKIFHSFLVSKGLEVDTVQRSFNLFSLNVSFALCHIHASGLEASTYPLLPLISSSCTSTRTT